MFFHQQNHQTSAQLLDQFSRLGKMEMHTLNHGTTSCLDGSDIWPNQEKLGESHHFFFGGGGWPIGFDVKQICIYKIYAPILKYMYLSYIHISSRAGCLFLNHQHDYHFVANDLPFFFNFARPPGIMGIYCI